MTAEERSLLEALDAIVGSEEIRAQIYPVIDTDAPLERRWISSPRSVWHQVVVPEGPDWVVVSFHTVPAEELIEERPDFDDPGGTKQMRYLGRDQRRKK